MKDEMNPVYTALYEFETVRHDIDALAEMLKRRNADKHQHVDVRARIKTLRASLQELSNAIGRME